MAALAPAYAPRRPTETVLYGLVREHLESFLAYAREHYERGLPPYVEAEFRSFLKCGVFAEGFTRARCEACGYDLLVAFSCHRRTVCPSCSGRRMANTAAYLVDRVLPDVPVRQYVLTLPYELRKLAAFRADVLTALARIFVESVFAVYRAQARRRAIVAPQGGSVTFVQRFGSLNLHVHLHVLVLDGVFAKDAAGRLAFHPAQPPHRLDLEAIVERVSRLSASWLRRHGYIDESPPEARSNELSRQTAIDACAAIATGRGSVATLSRNDHDPHVEKDEPVAGKRGAGVERAGFNVHAAVRIAAGDDLGRERLCRYGARPPLSLERLRRLPGARIAYRLKYVDRGRKGKHRLMTAMEFMARLVAIIAPPRYPLVRYGGVLAPRSAWRALVVPRPPERSEKCHAQRPDAECAVKLTPRKGATSRDGNGPGSMDPAGLYVGQTPSTILPAASNKGDIHGAAPGVPSGATLIAAAPEPGEVTLLAPNILAVRHWDRLLGGILYATSPRVDWATLLRRSFQVDVLECPKCHGRLRIVGVLSEREPVRRILAHLGLPTETPPLARARDPTDDLVHDEDDGQLSLGLA